MRLVTLQVLDRRRVALGVVAVDQRLAGLAGEDEGELPAEVGGVLDAVVAAARAERADDVGGVADEERAADAKGVEQVVAVLVRADPDELELDVGAELLAQARAGDLGPADRLRVGSARPSGSRGARRRRPSGAARRRGLR